MSESVVILQHTRSGDGRGGLHSVILCLVWCIYLYSSALSMIFSHFICTLQDTVGPNFSAVRSFMIVVSAMEYSALYSLFIITPQTNT